jgi:hypothetical protein
MLQKPLPPVQILQEGEAAGNTSDVDVDQQLLSESVGRVSLPDVPCPNGSHPNVRLPDVPFPDFSLSGLHGSVGEE